MMRGAALDEVTKFGTLRSYWWDYAGPLRTLHLFNRMRARYMHDAMQRYVEPYSVKTPRGQQQPSSLSASLSSSLPSSLLASSCATAVPSYRVLDVGCGGGILSESLARLGATVLGIDACEGSIAAAVQRLQANVANARARYGVTAAAVNNNDNNGNNKDNDDNNASATSTTTTQQQWQLYASSWVHRMQFRHMSVYDLLDGSTASSSTAAVHTASPARTSEAQDTTTTTTSAPPNSFDVVVASEVIEHVDDARGFLSALCALTRPGGLLLLSTMDKSLRAALSHLLIAEHLTGLVHPGTHDWAKFVPPHDVTTFAARHGVRAVDVQYIVAYPDVCQSIAACNVQLSFALTRRVDTGHYLWAGVKRADTAPAATTAAATSATAAQHGSDDDASTATTTAAAAAAPVAGDVAGMD